jgi:cell division transport system permease protein
MFEDDPAILEIIEEDPSILPASLRIRPEDSDTYAAISDRLEATPGVQEVLRQDETIEEARDFNDLINQLILIAAVALGVVAVVLIANTIRMAIYARRDEIGIMKLVGAGNWFIRVPFLLEGMFEGLIGAVLAIALVFGGYQLLLDRRDDLPALIDPEISTEFILQWGLITLAAGVLVGILGSGIALRRFLRE